MLEQVLARIDESREAALPGLFEFLKIPSVSTDPARAGDVRRCARWLVEQLTVIGLKAEIHETGGHPVVLAKNAFHSGRPTVLLYGHYDVQPTQPDELWETPPFEPVVRQQAVYARGAADDKGQIYAHMQALKHLQQLGGIPVNLTILIEGEEEIGSPNLAAFIKSRQAELRADIALISDSNQFARGIPAITYGLRGLVYEEIFLQGPSHDLHSGMFGGSVPNPANVLAMLIASLHDSEGKVNIPGFYDDVRQISPDERQMWRKLPVDETELAKEVGLESLCGEKDYTALERRWARPTCDVNGLTAGYQGEGAKTVIAARASAKISMRLVPGQNPARIREAFEKAIRERCPKNVQVSFKNHGMGEALLVPIDSPAMRLAAEAIRRGFAAEPVFIREGGSIPIVSVFKQVLGVDTLLVGFGLNDDRVHSPNEKFDLDSLHKGTRTAAALYYLLSGLKR